MTSLVEKCCANLNNVYIGNVATSGVTGGVTGGVTVGVTVGVTPWVSFSETRVRDLSTMFWGLVCVAWVCLWYGV